MNDSDIKMFLSQEASDDATNGGRASTTLVVSGVTQNVWSHVNKATRDAGNEPDGQYRKVHVANQNADDEALMTAGLIYDGDTLGADHAYFFPVSHDAEQSDWVSGSEQPSRKYVSGVLKTTLLTTDTSATVVFDDADQSDEVLDGDEIYFSDKATPDAATGDTVIVTVSGTPSISSNEVTFTFTPAIGVAFAADDTNICVIYRPTDDIEPSVGTQTNSIAGTGTLDDTAITFDNQGTIRQELTLNFTSTTAFDVTSDESGVTLASGSISSVYTPINPDNSKEYLSIPTAAWTDTDFAAADWIKLPLNPANIPQVQQRIIPASCASLNNNRLRVVCIGESEA